MLKYFALFTLVPVFELWLLIEVGKIIGTLPTVFLVASTGFFGVILAKSEGLSVIRRIGEGLAEGDLPGDQLIDGGCILVGGAFLLTPGLITDILGFSLLIPLTRALIKPIIRKILRRKIKDNTIDIDVFPE